jgi:hypothetical protein
MRRGCSPCCARAASGQAAAPPNMLKNSRRRHPPPPAQDRHRSGSHTSIEDLGDVRFGSLAGIAAANRDIRFSSAKADIGPSLIL